MAQLYFFGELCHTVHRLDRGITNEKEEKNYGLADVDNFGCFTLWDVS